MNQKINHRDLEQFIGRPCRCDDHLQLKIVGFYPAYNKIAVAARRGEDKFFLSGRGSKTDLSEAIPLDGRYLVIGDPKDIDARVFNACTIPCLNDVWLKIPEDFFITRLLIAGAIRIITITSDLSPSLAQTAEYQQALKDGRIIELVC